MHQKMQGTISIFCEICCDRCNPPFMIRNCGHFICVSLQLLASASPLSLSLPSAGRASLAGAPPAAPRLRCAMVPRPETRAPVCRGTAKRTVSASTRPGRARSARRRCSNASSTRPSKTCRKATRGRPESGTRSCTNQNLSPEDRSPTSRRPPRASPQCHQHPPLCTQHQGVRPGDSRHPHRRSATAAPPPAPRARRRMRRAGGSPVSVGLRRQDRLVRATLL